MVTLQEALDGWILTLRQRGATHRTIENYTATMVRTESRGEKRRRQEDSAWIPFIDYARPKGVETVEQLSSPLLRKYQVECMSHLAPATAIGRVAILKAFGS